MFWVNGISVEADDEELLIDVLRNQLKLLSVKRGCMQGVCGTCSVIVDGALRRSCTCRASVLKGTHIITTEGLSAREQEVYSYAFAKAGAVQCGYCLPGMVLASKCLLDQNTNPDEAQFVSA